MKGKSNNSSISKKWVGKPLTHETCPLFGVITETSKIM